MENWGWEKEGSKGGGGLRTILGKKGISATGGRDLAYFQIQPKNIMACLPTKSNKKSVFVTVVSVIWGGGGRGELPSSSWLIHGGEEGVGVSSLCPWTHSESVTYNCLSAFSLPKTSWIIQPLTHRRTTRVETDGGGDKDSTENPGVIHSTQQPEDPSE